MNNNEKRSNYEVEQLSMKTQTALVVGILIALGGSWFIPSPDHKIETAISQQKLEQLKQSVPKSTQQ